MKYCVNCGNPMDDNEFFCGNCGAQNAMGESGTTTQPPLQENQPTQQYQQPTQQYQQPYVNQTKPSGGKNILIIGIVAAIAVIAIAVGLVLIFKPGKSSSNNSDSEKVISNLMDAMNDSDTDKMTELFLDDVKSEYASEIQTTFGQMAEYIDAYGIDYSIDYKINDKEELDSDDLESLNSQIADYGDSEVTEAYNYDINVSFEISGNVLGQDISNSDESDTKVIVGKCDGKWYIVSMDGLLDY